MDELEKVNIEAFFGVSAGKVWQCLTDHVEMKLNDIARCTSLGTEEVCYALGWLGQRASWSPRSRAGY